VRTYHGVPDRRGLPTVLVSGDGRLRELSPWHHPRCADPGHGWGEEAQSLNTSWTILSDALGGPNAKLAFALCHEYRAQVISRITASDWALTTEDVLRWVIGALLVYAWPITTPVSASGEGVDHEPLR
jgi:hypothetical protein